MIHFQDDHSFNIIKRHHERNRVPRPPDPEQPNTIRSQHVMMDLDAADDNETTDGDSDMLMDDNRRRPRAQHHSHKPYTGRTTDPKKLGFYPAQWRDILEAGQKKWHLWLALVCGFPNRENEDHLEKALSCLIEAKDEHTEKGGRVEPGMNKPFDSDCSLINHVIGYWPEHQDDMREYVCQWFCIILLLTTWHRFSQIDQPFVAKSRRRRQQ